MVRAREGKEERKHTVSKSHIGSLITNEHVRVMSWLSCTPYIYRSSYITDEYKLRKFVSDVA
jgi:hypothetical protein